MLTLGLIFVGVAVAVFGSILRPRHADPMGMFGLPSVFEIACRPTSVNNRTGQPAPAVLRREDRKATCMYAPLGPEASAGFKGMGVKKPINSASLPKLCPVIVSGPGSLVRYSTDPGRCEHREAAEPATGLSVAHQQNGNHSARWAA